MAAAAVQNLSEDEIGEASEPDSLGKTWAPKPRSRHEHERSQKSKSKESSRSQRHEKIKTQRSTSDAESGDDHNEDYQGKPANTEGSRKGKVTDSPTSKKSKSRSSRHRRISNTSNIGSLSPSTPSAGDGRVKAKGHRRSPSEKSPYHDRDPETYISFKTLPKLARVEPNSRGHFVTSMYKYEKPLSGLQIRVRLLKYPSLTQRTEWPDDLQVLEDRVFSWQEKVFSKSEAEFYMSKRNVVTEIDEHYHKELISNSTDTVGKHFYSYVQSDFIVNAKDLPNSTLRRCANKHSRKMTKLAGNLLETKLVNSDGESIILDENFEDGDYQRSIIPKSNFTEFRTAIGGKLSRNRKGDKTSNKDQGTEMANGENIAAQLRQNLTAEERQKEQEKAITEAEIREREGQMDEERKENALMRRRVKEMKTEDKKKKLQQQEIKKIGRENEFVKRWAGSQRPSAALSARMKSHQLTPSKLKKSDIPSKRTPEKTSKWPKSKSKSDKRRDSVEQILEPRLLAEQSAVTTGDPNYSVNDLPPGGDTKRSKEFKEGIRGKSSAKLMSQKSRSHNWFKIRGVVRLYRKSVVKSFRTYSQSMYIMASIPHMTRRKRNVVVCSLQTCPKAGVLLVKPDFGYRIVEAKRNQVYRLSWELLVPEDAEKNKEEKAKNWRTKFNPLDGDKESASRDDSLLDQIGDMFEMVSSKEMRLVVLGEILCTEGFDKDPICVHYFMDTPKGWRNDSVSSSLVGITHSCYNNSDRVAHFSHHFYSQLAFSMDSVDEDETYPRPMLILMVVALVSPSRVRHEGYAYVPIPSQPGHHEIKIQTWKPEPRTNRDKMLDVFLDITPSLQDIRAVHVPINENEECRRPNRLGLKTIPSGFIKLRLHVLHQTHSMDSGQLDKLDLLEKMSSATILRNVQTVIAAFQRAKNRSKNVKGQ